MKKYRVETKNGCFLGIIEGKRAFNKWFEERQKYNTYTKKEDCVLVEVKESHATTYTVFDSYDTCSDENMKSAKENLIDNMFWDEDEDGCITTIDNYGKEVKLTREEYGNSISDDRLYEECYDMERMWFEDEQWELKNVSEGEVIAIADLGLWNGRCGGYKNIKSLEEIMYSECDYERVYVDSNGDLRKDESHHDGSNSILYRYWKDGLSEEQKENFLDKIYYGKVTQKDITRYTRKAGLGIANAFGWTVRGGENKYKKVA